MIGIVMKESEIQIMKHIQSKHPEKHLVVETAGNEVNLTSEESEAGSDNNQNYSKMTFSQDDVFYPCDSCDAIFMSLEGKRSHSLSHEVQRKVVKTGIVKQKKVTSFSLHVQNEPRKCPVCSQI